MRSSVCRRHSPASPPSGCPSKVAGVPQAAVPDRQVPVQKAQIRSARVGNWLIARQIPHPPATLHRGWFGSDRPHVQRLESGPMLDWSQPQLPGLRTWLCRKGRNVLGQGWFPSLAQHLLGVARFHRRPQSEVSALACSVTYAPILQARANQLHGSVGSRPSQQPS